MSLKLSKYLYIGHIFLEKYIRYKDIEVQVVLTLSVIKIKQLCLGINLGYSKFGSFQRSLKCPNPEINLVSR